MSYIVEIATAVPQHSVSNPELINFYSKALAHSGGASISRKLKILSEKSKIANRYSCIPDFNGEQQELFTSEDYNPSVERRTEVYKEKLVPLATKAIDKLLEQAHIKPIEITHLITVSCTGVFAPGLEFLLAKHYDLQHAEKLALNFLGCYAAIKALKHANYIAQAIPSACIVIVCAELCSLHFTPSTTDDDMLANILFADGAAAVMVVGDESPHIKNKTTLHIDAGSSAYIPNTLDLMSWNISSTAFSMYLSKHIVGAIRENIFGAVNNFWGDAFSSPDYWAIHPGGVKIVEAVRSSLALENEDVEDSLQVLANYGNMSSPTILFILKRIMDKLKEDKETQNKKIFACAFGPGLNIEMLNLSILVPIIKKASETTNIHYAVQI